MWIEYNYHKDKNNIQSQTRMKNKEIINKQDWEYHLKYSPLKKDQLYRDWYWDITDKKRIHSLDI